MKLFHSHSSPSHDVSVERQAPAGSNWRPDDQDFRRVLESVEVEEGRDITIEIGDVGIVVTRFDGHPRAFLDVCPHWGGSFLDDPVQGDEVVCPWHFWCWSLATGQLMSPTRSEGFPLRWVPARERDGWIEVAVPPTAEPTDRAARSYVRR